MSEVIADTHAIIWYLTEPHKLSAPALQALNKAEQFGRIFVPTITLVEMTYLIERRRIDQLTLDELQSCLTDPFEPIEAIPLTIKIVLEMAFIPRSIVPDMPDRIIAATAFSSGLGLVTADSRIRLLTNVKTIW